MLRAEFECRVDELRVSTDFWIAPRQLTAVVNGSEQEVRAVWIQDLLNGGRPQRVSESRFWNDVVNRPLGCRKNAISVVGARTTRPQLRPTDRRHGCQVGRGKRPPRQLSGKLGRDKLILASVLFSVVERLVCHACARAAMSLFKGRR